MQKKILHIHSPYYIPWAKKTLRTHGHRQVLCSIKQQAYSQTSKERLQLLFLKLQSIIGQGGVYRATSLPVEVLLLMDSEEQVFIVPSYATTEEPRRLQQMLAKPWAHSRAPQNRQNSKKKSWIREESHKGGNRDGREIWGGYKIQNCMLYVYEIVKELTQ